MLRLDGIVKVLDFGLAKLTEEQPAADLSIDAADEARAVLPVDRERGIKNLHSDTAT